MEDKLVEIDGEAGGVPATKQLHVTSQSQHKTKSLVFLILWLQLTGFCILEYFGLFTPGGRGLFQQWRWMLHLGVAGFFLTLLAMFVKQKSPPWSYLVIFLWTFSGGYGIASFVMTYDLDVFFVSSLCACFAMLLCFAVWSLQPLSFLTSGKAIAIVNVVLIVIVSLVAQNVLFFSSYELMQSIVFGLVLTLYGVSGVYRLCTPIKPDSATMAAYVAELVIGVYLAFFNPLEYVRTFNFLLGRV